MHLSLSGQVRKGPFVVNQAIFDALRRVYGGQARREHDNYFGYLDF